MAGLRTFKRQAHTLRLGLLVNLALLAAPLVDGADSGEKPAMKRPPNPPELTVVQDPIVQERRAFAREVYAAFERGDYDFLEETAAQLRADNALFGDGSWKLYLFYSALGNNCYKSDEKWRAVQDNFQEWMQAKPRSGTARIAYSKFLSSYAWAARGGGWASTVTPQGWKLFHERLALARSVLTEVRQMNAQDAYWWVSALKVALGQGWNKVDYDALVEEGKAYAPTFWGIDTSRAYSLLPRWYGKTGDWEAYAAWAADQPDGLGDEVYARCVIRLRGFYDNVFKDTDASWPRTKTGLAIMREKYPDSMGILVDSILLAGYGDDRELAAELLEKLGNNYCDAHWYDETQMLEYQYWAKTGKWLNH